ncbi:DEAD/DEAH box helicase family protein [uncultured Clostridium sp.]|uniref:DEAD/DEAH box helicase family protein n=1 Tax=uncultured Clostridium sp. TaxID=59620 RepID=UPI00262C4065|nr:DEAD/DEAH box helicase family protein [uncultured Clostridium sp.]
MSSKGICSEETLQNKEILIKEKEIGYSENCILGGDNDYLIDRLNKAFNKAVRVDIIVSFLRETGVRLLKKDLTFAREKGTRIRILTGNYLGITEPSALYLMRDILGKDCDMRFYKDSRRSFHPKAYIFHYEGGQGDIFIGSSNISLSALTKGLEWNYRIEKEKNEEDFQYFNEAFENLFFNQSIILDDEELKKYSKSWTKPKIQKILLETEDEEEKVVSLFQPRGAQIEALTELKKMREEEIDKALVVAATGIGKTYLAAFDTEGYKKVLFLAHREELLTQAANSFKTIKEDFKIGFFKGDLKEKAVDGLFASVSTLGKKEYLTEEYYSKDYFDYIVIDEVHHAVSKNYLNILEYFKPKFTLGITATPERMDNRDVFRLFDYNVAYEIRLFEAVNKGYLCPFRYYGIYDNSINYEEIGMQNGRYKESELEKKLMIDKRANLVLNHYKKYKSKRAIGFCSTKNHAEYMAEYFNKNGIKACAVYSNANGENSLERTEAIEKIKKGEIKVIFSVDMFNEGVDIKSLDMVMFLRPTESSTVFLQQLGRGLRLDKDKEYVNVLDFIGNYKKADMIPNLIGKSTKEFGKGDGDPRDFKYPEDCLIDFDLEIIDIFKKMANRDKKIKDFVIEEYFSIKEFLGHRPTREEFIESIEGEIYLKAKTGKKNNPFKNYLEFLKEIKETTMEEEKFLKAEEFKLLNYIETTAMSKTYKMPLLMGFYNNGDFKLEIDEDEIYQAMKSFYSNSINKQDLLSAKGTKNIDSWEKQDYLKKAREMPIKFLLNSGEEFFYSNEEKTVFGIKEEFKAYKENKLYKQHFIDAVKMRVIEYYKNRKK